MTTDRDEQTRVRLLQDLGILDTPPEQRFDQLTEELAERLAVPIAFLALVDGERQWIKSKVGMVPAEVERERSFAAPIVETAEALVVADAAETHVTAGFGLVIKEDYQHDLAVDVSDRAEIYSLSLVKFF